VRRGRAIVAWLLAPAQIATAVAATAADEIRIERSLLRHLHFEYGLVVACGLADDEVEAGYRLRVGRLEQRLGIDDDSEARYRELNLGWTESDADWAAKGGPAFRDWCLNEAASARDRFRQAFRDTGEKLGTPAKGKGK
jgi:hypothetical protein